MQLQRFTASITAAVVLTFGASAAANAQPHGGPRHHGTAHAHGPHYGPQPPGWHGGHRPWPQVHHHPGYRPSPGHRVHPGYRPPPPPQYYYGAGPQRNWVRGSRIPPHYREQRYVVQDWQARRLHRPPQGHHWVQHGSDYMLVAIASGVITQLILNGGR